MKSLFSIKSQMEGNGTARKKSASTAGIDECKTETCVAESKGGNHPSHNDT